MPSKMALPSFTVWYYGVKAEMGSLQKACRNYGLLLTTSLSIFSKITDNSATV